MRETGPGVRIRPQHQVIVFHIILAECISCLPLTIRIILELISCKSVIFAVHYFNIFIKRKTVNLYRIIQ